MKMLTLPSSRSKRYSSGMDWVMCALDYMSKKKTGCGNTFQLVLELEGRVPEEGLGEALTVFAQQFPALYGRPSRDYNLAPYWKYSSTRPSAVISVKTVEVMDEDAAYARLDEESNRPLSYETEYIRAVLVRDRGRSYLGFSFDHRLFDARGGELFLDRFATFLRNRSVAKRMPALVEPAHLDHWGLKFRAGKQINRALIRASKKTSPRKLPFTVSGKRARNVFRHYTFSKAKTASLLEQAEERAGFLMLLPYTLALTVQVMDRLFSRRGVKTGDLIIPVTVDYRGREKKSDEIFFNQLSFLFFQIRESKICNLPELIALIKEQMYTQIKKGMPQSLQQASLLTRILPLPVFAMMMGRPGKWPAASFSFATLGESAFQVTNWRGSPVTNMMHRPRVPVIPGLGVFFSQFNGRLNVVLSYLEGLLSEDEADLVIREMSELA